MMRERGRRRPIVVGVGLAALLAIVPPAVSAGPGDDTGVPAVRRATLDNGLRVVIVPSHLAPVVTTTVNYLVGGNETPDGFPGMAHAQEHMMFRGSPGLTADQIASIGAAVGGSFDAQTQQTVTQYSYTVPAEDLDVVLHLEALRMRGVLDRDDLWAQERGAIEQEVDQDLSNPQYIAYTKVLATLFAGSPYAHDALGTRASFEKTTGAMLRAFHDDWYAPNNAILVIVGAVSPAPTLERIKALFGGIPARPLPARRPVRLGPLVARRYDGRTDLPYGLAMIAFRLPGLDSPDVAAAQVLADVLNSRRGDLYGLVADGKALDASFSTQFLPKAGLGYAVASFPRGAPPDRLLADLRGVLAAAARGALTADLVESAKRREIADSEREKNSLPGLAAAWSRALAVEGRQSPDDDTRAIAQVSVADVRRVAARYLDLRSAAVSVLTPESSGRPTAPREVRRKESPGPSPRGPVPLPDWAAGALTRLTVPALTVRPVVTRLGNGVTLIVQPESISDTVSVFGHIKNTPALQVPAGQEGVDEVLDRLFDFGTTSLDRLAFQKALDAIAADESAGAEFALSVPAGSFDEGVRLLADHELHPALPEAAFRVVQRQVADTVAGRLQSPDYLTGRALKAALLPRHDPTLRQATSETVSALRLEDVRAYYAAAFRPDLTTIVVIGKVTPADAAAVVEKYFAGWHAAGPKPETELPAVPLNAPSAAVVPNASRVQDKVILAETVGLTRSDPDYYALELGDHVLGGAFYATRLYHELREEAGLVYFVSTFLDVGKTRGFYGFEYACDPAKVSTARAVIERELGRMQTSAVTADELRQAKVLLLRQIPLAEASVDDIAGGLLSRAVRDLPLDEPVVAARRYVALTADQVQAAFARWIRRADLVQVTEGPSPH